MAAAIFIKTGKLEQHLRRMKRNYSQKYQVFQDSLSQYHLDFFEWVDTSAGLHLFGSWKYSKEDYLLFEQECAKNGVSWQSADYYFTNSPLKPTVIFGFSHLSEEDIKIGIKTMSEVYKDLKIRKNY